MGSALVFPFAATFAFAIFIEVNLVYTRKTSRIRLRTHTPKQTTALDFFS